MLGESATAHNEPAGAGNAVDTQTRTHTLQCIGWQNRGDLLNYQSNNYLQMAVCTYCVHEDWGTLRTQSQTGNKGQASLSSPTPMALTTS